MADESSQRQDRLLFVGFEEKVSSFWFCLLPWYLLALTSVAKHMACSICQGGDNNEVKKKEHKGRNVLLVVVTRHLVIVSRLIALARFYTTL